MKIEADWIKRLITWGGGGLAMMIGAYFFTQSISRYYTLSLNLTNSLDGTLYFVRKGVYPSKKNELVVFTVNPNPFYPKGTVFIKIVAGMEGDRVSIRKNRFYVGSQDIGYWYATATSGEVLSKGPIGIIPENHYFVYTTHPRSYDSRYQRVGWISRDKVIGTASKIF